MQSDVEKDKNINATISLLFFTSLRFLFIYKNEHNSLMYGSCDIVTHTGFEGNYNLAMLIII